jgi:hypothetical protein
MFKMKMRIYTALLVLLIAGVSLFCTSCSNATRAEIGAWGQRHVIKQYSGGELLGIWYSTGKIENEAHSDGYYFQDERGDKLVSVSGDIQITVSKSQKVGDPSDGEPGTYIDGKLEPTGK